MNQNEIECGFVDELSKSMIRTKEGMIEAIKTIQKMAAHYNLMVRRAPWLKKKRR